MTTKNKLIWRLKEQPTTESLRELVRDKILTNDEARSILFSSETEESRDKASLESEIKFLRDLIEKLSQNKPQNKPQIVEVIRQTDTPYYYNDWYKPYLYWCNTSPGGSSVTLTAGTTASGGINALTGTTTTGSSSALNNFSNIKTF